MSSSTRATFSLQVPATHFIANLSKLLVLMVLLSYVQLAQAVVTFLGVEPNTYGSQVPIGGSLTMTIKGAVKSSVTGDTIKKLTVMEGGTVIFERDFTSLITFTNGVPNNPWRQLASNFTLKKGVHQIFLRATTWKTGQTKDAGPWTITVTEPAPKPPLAQLTAPGSSYQITSGSTYPVPITGSTTAYSPAAMQSATLYVDGAASSVAVGSFSTTRNLAAGNHTVELKAVDTAGATHTVTRQVTVQPPAPPAAPVINFTAPTAGSVFSITSGTTYPVRITANASVSSGLSVSAVYVWIDGTSYLQPASTSIDFTRSLPGGRYDLAIVVQDSYGNVTTTPPRAITVLAPAPNASVNSIVAPPSVVEAGKPFQVSLQMKNTGNTTWTNSGSNPTKLGSVNPNDNSTWGLNRVSLPLSSVAPTGVAAFTISATAPTIPGTYNFQWRMLNEGQGFFGAATDNYAIRVDATPPALAITSPAQGAKYNIAAGGSTANVSFTGTANALSGFGMKSLQFYKDGVAFGAAGTTSITASKDLAAGTHTIELRGVDSRDVPQSTSVTVTVAPPPPTISFAVPANGTELPISTGTTYPVNISAVAFVTAPATLSSVVVKAGGNSYTPTVNRNVSQVANLPPGDHDIWIEVTDSFGSFAKSEVRRVKVLAAAPRADFIRQTAPPTTVEAGSTHAVSITMKNSGYSPWLAGGANPARLGSKSPTDNMNWGLNRMSLSTDVPVGGEHTFNANVTAPSLPGTYDFQWMMLREGLTVFGFMTDKVAVQVVQTAPVVSITSHSDGMTVGAGLSGKATLNLAGTAVPVSGVLMDKLQFHVDGQPLLPAGTTSANASVELAVGTHQIDLIGTDKRGISATRRILVTVTAGPTVTISEPVDNSYLLITSGTTYPLTVRGTAVAGAPATLSNVVVFVDSNANQIGAVGTVNHQVALSAGEYAIAIQATDSNRAIGTSEVRRVKVVSGSVGNAAKLESQTIPTRVRPGEPFTAKVVMRNMGTTTWTEGEGYRLGATNPQDSRIWTPNARAYLTAPVAPGQLATFNVEVTAPQQTGTYAMQWRMLRESVEWFGQATDSVQVEVAAGAGPTVTFAVSPTNSQVGVLGHSSLHFTGKGTRIGGTITKLELLMDSGRGFEAPFYAVNGASTESLELNWSLNRTAGVFRYKLRATDHTGAKTDSEAVIVNVASLALQGKVLGVRTNVGNTTELYGWACELGQAAPLNLEILLDAPTRASGGVLLTTATANVGTEWDSAAISSTCGTPGSPHNFVVNLSSYLQNYAGRSLYVVAANASGTKSVSLVCEEGRCKMPGVANGSPFLGAVTGVRLDASQNPQLVGWACRSSSAAALAYKLYVNAPPSQGGIEVAGGVANVAHETGDASVRQQCQTPDTAHHFVIDLASLNTQYPGAPLFVKAVAADGSSVVLTCQNNNCTMPGTLRIGLTSPNANNQDRFRQPSPAFLRAQVSGATGAIDEVLFNVNGEWLPGVAEGSGAYSVNKAGLVPSATPYSVHAKVRQGGITIMTSDRQFYIDAGDGLLGEISPGTGTNLVLNESRVLSVKANGALPIGASVKFFVDRVGFAKEGPQGTVGQATSANGAWTYAWSPTQEGFYEVTAKVMDGAGQPIMVSQSVLLSVIATTGAGEVKIDVTDPVQLQNPVAGTLPGGVTTHGGSAQYTIPLQLPPGVPGMAPLISLSYDSNSTTGTAGVGWNLGGFSSIDRCGKTVATDKRADAVRFKALVGEANVPGSVYTEQPVDRLCLDGHRLVLVNGDQNSDAAYWKDGAEYRTEVESFVRVTSKITGGKHSFVVERRDGSIARYGDTSDSYVVGVGPEIDRAHRWRISNRADQAGNHIDFTYNANQANGESKPTKVRWGGNTKLGKPHFAIVEFEYVNRTDVRAAYVAGSPAADTTRLLSITTRTDTDANGIGGTVGHTYKLGYEDSPTSARSLLKTVRICDRNDVCLPATTFEWGRPRVGATREFVQLGGDRTGPNLGALSNAQDNPGSIYAPPMTALETVLFGDFNNDGRVDILERYQIAENNWSQRLYESTADGTAWNVRRPFVATSGLAVMETGDFDGDGLTDILVANGSTHSQTNWRMCWGRLRVGEAFDCSAAVSIPDAASKPANIEKPPLPARAVKDFNADGKDDLFIRTGDQQDYKVTDPRFQCLSTGTDFACRNVAATPENISFGGNGDRVRPAGSIYADFDGDGRNDHLQLGKCTRVPREGASGMEWVCENDTMLGDSTIQVYAETEPGAVKMQGQWMQFPSTPTMVLPPPDSGTLTGDFNADGYTDLVFGVATMEPFGFKPKAFSGWACYSKGDGSGDCKQLPSSGTAGHLDHLVMMVADFDGDGVVDVLRPAVDTWDADNIPAYRLCRVNGDGSSHRCEDWSGPTYYGLSERNRFLGSRLLNDAPRSMFMGDFNGDGRTDIATYAGGSTWRIYGPAEQAAAGQALDRLVGVTNGLGYEERIDYDTAANTALYQPEATLPDGGAIRVGKRSYPTTPLVKAIRRADGQGGWRETSYEYAGQAQDAGGRGSLGFARVRSTDKQSGMVSTQWMEQTFPHIGAVRFAQHRSAGGALLSDQVDTLAVKTIKPVERAETPYPYVLKSEVSRRDLDNSELAKTVTELLELDEWGNVKQSKVSTTRSDAAEPWTVETTADYTNDVSKWRLGQLKSSSEKRSVTDSTVTRTRALTYYDESGLLATEVRQGGNAALALTTSYARNGFGTVTDTTLGWTDPATGAAQTRVVSKVAYEANGRFPKTQENAAGHVETVTFDPVTGAKQSLVDANGHVTTWSSDNFGRIVMERRPDGNETWTRTRQCTVSCPAGAATVTIVEPKRANGTIRTGTPTLAFADSAGRVLRTLTYAFDGRLVARDVRYDNRGRATTHFWPRFVEGADALASASGPLESAEIEKLLSYDDLDRVTATHTHDSDGGWVISRTEYHGPVVKHINARGYSQTLKNDRWGRLAESIDAKDNLTKYKFDAFNNLVRTEDPLHNVVKVEYDALGRRTQLIDPDLGKIDYSVDPLGQVWKQVSPNQFKDGTFTLMKYDVLGRMVARDESSMKARWIYDKEGTSTCAALKTCGKLRESHTLKGEVPDFVQQHQYDEVGRPSVVTRTIGGTTYRSTQEYDGWGRLITERHKRGSGAERVFSYRYNGMGELSRIERSGLVLWQAMSEDAAGRPTGAMFGNGLYVTRGFSSKTGRLNAADLNKSATDTRLQEAYSYDGLGNVTQRTQYWRGSGFIENFTYDALNRLETAQVVGQAIQDFKYDAIGNLKSKTGAGSGDYVYPASGDASVRPHAVTSIPGYGAFTYDDNGNMLSGPGRTNTWTSFDMPAMLKKGDVSSTFVYGADRQRVMQIRADATIEYAGAMEAEVRANNSVTLKTYWPMGLGVEIEEGGTTKSRWMHQDRLGSVIALTDELGATVDELGYDSWGRRRNRNGTWADDNLDGKEGNNRGYTGHEMLDQVDLVHMNGRVYDPFTARFISADPIIQDPTHSQSYNRYSYVWNNPTNLTDPTGFQAKTEEEKRKEPTPQEKNDEAWKVKCNRDMNSSCQVFAGNNSNSADSSGKPKKSAISGTTAYGGVNPVKAIAGAIADGIASAVDWVIGMPGRIGERIMDPSKRVPVSTEEVLQAGMAIRGGALAAQAEAPLVGICFVAGTPIHTSAGVKAIEQIEPGDLVYAIDPSAPSAVVRPVVRKFHNRDQPIIRVTVRDEGGNVEVIGVTPEHPFWVGEKGWTAAHQLRSGDSLQGLGAGRWSVMVVSDFEERADTFNFEVQELHTYFVGSGGVLVHNQSKGKDALSKLGSKDAYENPGHHDPSGGGPNPYNRSKSVLPSNHNDLWEKSGLAADGNRWTKVGSGSKAEYHRFQSDGNGNWHWNGSTVGETAGGQSRQIKLDQVPIEVKRW